MENSIEIKSLNEVRQKERMKIICSEITKGKSKKDIAEEYSKKWSCAKCTIRAIINEAIVLLFQENPQTREQLRTLNLARLDEIYEDCTTIKEKIKTIDTINKTAGIYEQILNIGNKDSESFKFDIGVNANGN